MRNKYTLEIVFLVLVLALSVAGFSNLFTGKHAELDQLHVLHIVTSFAWLFLLLSQLILLRGQRGDRHRVIGKSIFAAGPVLVASLALLTVHSAAKDAALGRADAMVVQNVLVTLEVAMLIFLAFILRKNRSIHGALLLSTSLLFMGIALFFTLISYVPGYKIEGPETFYRFGEAAKVLTMVCGVVALLFFIKSWRTGWPWLLAGAFFFLNGFVQMLVGRMEATKHLTFMVASIGRASAFAYGFVIFVALLWVAWRVGEVKRKG